MIYWYRYLLRGYSRYIKYINKFKPGSKILINLVVWGRKWHILITTWGQSSQKNISMCQQILTTFINTFASIQMIFCTFISEQFKHILANKKENTWHHNDVLSPLWILFIWYEKLIWLEVRLLKSWYIFGWCFEDKKQCDRISTNFLSTLMKKWNSCYNKMPSTIQILFLQEASYWKLRSRTMSAQSFKDFKRIGLVDWQICKTLYVGSVWYFDCFLPISDETFKWKIFSIRLDSVV